jgi:hypothetical protein
MIDLSQEKEEVAGSCDHAHEHYGYINCMECLVQLRNYQLLKKDSAQSG